MEWLTRPLFAGYPPLTPRALADIAITALLIYQFLVIVRGRRAAHVLGGVVVLVTVYVLSVYAKLEMLRGMLATLAPYTVFALIVMFQSEIRRVLARIGRRSMLQWGARLERREFIEETLLAVEYLAQRKEGALIVLERDIGLRTFIESGVLMDAVVSRDLLLAIFQANGALHDGAVIVQGQRIAAAACFLPLSMNPALLSTMGTRHRAAIGITEETDCLSLVVSEETGRISVAAFGEIESNLTLAQARAKLDHHFGWQRRRADGRSVRGARQESMEAGREAETDRV